MIDWKKKLSSRKLWMAIAGLAVGIWVFVQNPSADNLSAIILMVGSVVAYILAEGWTDAANLASNTTHAEISGASAKNVVEAVFNANGQSGKEKTESK